MTSSPTSPLPGGPAPSGLAGFSPAYFGLVMATGIVSVGCYVLGAPSVAQALFHLNIVAYGVLWILSIWRVARYPRQFFGDMIDHLRGPGFFTTVAASSILGSQYVLLADDERVATALWLVSVVLWVGLIYAIFAAFIVKERKPTLDHGISGEWLLAIVATQSIAVLSALLAAHIDQVYKQELNFFALSMWLWGGMLYIWMMALIFYRDTFFRFSAADLSPPFWINMGAMAISTLAGSLLILNAPDSPFLLSLLPFLKGFTVFYWATGTWWIPMLLVLSVWRHLYKRFPLEYDPLYWGAVFPLGMYAVGTQWMTVAMSLKFLWFLPAMFGYIALAAWMTAFAGMTYDVFRRLRAARSLRALFDGDGAGG